MAKRTVVRQVKRQASSNGRRGDVFSIRVTLEERARLQAAADAGRESWRTAPAQLGPWLKKVALEAAAAGAGRTSSTSTRPKPAPRRRMPGREARS
jgi:hypothetical protein